MRVCGCILRVALVPTRVAVCVAIRVFTVCVPVLIRSAHGFGTHVCCNAFCSTSLCLHVLQC